MTAAHISRMDLELSSLTMKVDKLDTFIRSETFYKLPNNEQYPLRSQLQIMREYQTILSERYARAMGWIKETPMNELAQANS
jgi:hypothetical protein